MPALVNTETRFISRAATLGGFAGSSAASDRAKIGGCSPKDAREPGKAGAAGSTPARSTICSECDGSGKRCMSINPSDPEWDCEDCGGSGEIEVEDEEEVDAAD